MKEYIEKDVALETTYEPFTMSMCISVSECNGMNRAREAIFKKLRDIPTVDAVEVVRCKDCKWYGSERNECHNPRYGNGWANYPSPSINEEYYCADGERREENE